MKIIILIFLFCSARATFYKQQHSTNQRYQKIIYEERSVPSQLACLQLCQFRDKKSFMTYHNGLCQCLKRSDKHEENKETMVDDVAMFEEVSKRNVKKGAKSCSEIKQVNQSADNGVYILNLRKPIKVYCEMDNAKGGWMRIGNIVVEKVLRSTEADELINLKRTTNIEDLYKAENENFAFSIPHLKDLNLTFTQLRFYCKKGDKVIHIITTKSEVLDFFMGKIKTPPQACGSYTTETDDTSTLSKSCQVWEKSGKWFKADIFDFPFFILVKQHYAVSAHDKKQYFSCDDGHTGSKKGEWRVYIR